MHKKLARSLILRTARLRDVHRTTYVSMHAYQAEMGKMYLKSKGWSRD